MSFRLDPDPPFASVVAIEPHRAARRDTNGSDRWLAWLGDACDPDNMHVEHGCYRSLKSSKKKKKCHSKLLPPFGTATRFSEGSGCTRNCPHSSGAKNPCFAIGLACHVAVDFCTHHKACIYINRSAPVKNEDPIRNSSARAPNSGGLDVGRWKDLERRRVGAIPTSRPVLLMEYYLRPIPGPALHHEPRLRLRGGDGLCPSRLSRNHRDSPC